MATHASILAWKISGTEESGRLQSMWAQSLSMGTDACRTLILNLNNLFNLGFSISHTPSRIIVHVS